MTYWTYEVATTLYLILNLSTLYQKSPLVPSPEVRRLPSSLIPVSRSTRGSRINEHVTLTCVRAAPVHHVTITYSTLRDMLLTGFPVFNFGKRNEELFLVRVNFYLNKNLDSFWK